MARPRNKRYGKFYFGSPCKKCGGKKRYSSNGNCVPCKRAESRPSELNRLYMREYVRRRRAEDPEFAERLREARRKHYREVERPARIAAQVAKQLDKDVDQREFEERVRRNEHASLRRKDEREREAYLRKKEITARIFR